MTYTIRAILADIEVQCRRIDDRITANLIEKLTHMLREAERDVNEADTAARKAAYSLEYHTKRLKRGELSNDWYEHAWEQDQAKARLVWLRAELAELNRSHIHLRHTYE